MSPVDQLFPCPVCGSHTIGDPGTYEICDVCGWEDDPVQSADAGYAGGANVESLNDAKARWQLMQRHNPASRRD